MSLEHKTPLWHISIASGMILALEMAFIRQIPAEVKAISYFTNLILMASFFGLGVGCIFSGRKWIEWLLPTGLLLVAGFIFIGRGIVIYSGSKEVHYWLQDIYSPGQVTMLPLEPAAVAIFLFTAMPFAALGRSLILAMRPHQNLKAYGWDILGSLAGTIFFVISAMFSSPPWIWAVVVSLVWAVVFVKNRALRIASVISGIVFISFSYSPLKHTWSPYYYIQYSENALGLSVFVNSSFHQLALNTASENNPHRDVIDSTFKKFSIGYDEYRAYHGNKSPKSVLIIGAGTGNDVNVALANGADEIVAVEIDPSILELGQKHNRSNPYGDPRVTIVVDDARHFMHSTDRKFDLLVFGTLDSQTLASGVSNLRLDNYVYTAESFARAKRLLVDGGMLVAYYSVMKDWLYPRIYTTIRTAFGDQMKFLPQGDPFLFNTIILGGNNLPELKDNPAYVNGFSDNTISTDDWPFIFLEKRTIAPVYLGLFAIIFTFTGIVYLLLKKVEPSDSFKPSFLFLGLGFTLVESAAVTRLSLLFGTTWVVNAVVFSSVLLAIYLSNMAVYKKRAPSMFFAWMGLFGSLLFNFFFPLDVLLNYSVWVRVLASALLVGFPVVCASICFSNLFEIEKSPGYALGINLIGAMAGGMIEWSSMLLGMKMVWLVALCVYLLAFLASIRPKNKLSLT